MFFSVIPAEAGIQYIEKKFWIPDHAAEGVSGMTPNKFICDTCLAGRQVLPKLAILASTKKTLDYFSSYCYSLTSFLKPPGG